jgi:hypothetical protein
VTAFVAAAVALYRAGAPLLPVALLALSAILLSFDHAFPFGSLTFASFLVAAFLLAAGWRQRVPGGLET